jgi:gliding motility-associated-like protein
MAGATMRIEFTTNDCTQGGHFGYAYIDVDENCSSPITGSTSCPSDSLLILTAPFGFQAYKWYTADFSTVLGTSNVIVRNPVPPPNTVYAVEITPYPNQGCLDTVYATVKYSGDIVDLKVQDPVNACVPDGVNLSSGLITSGSSPGLIYTYYTDASLSNHLFGPDLVTASGTYYIKGVNDDGCIAVKPVTVHINPLPVFSVNAKPQPIIRPATLDLSRVISGGAGINFSYWKDSLLTIPADRPDAVDKSGSFYIKGTTAAGCSSTLSTTVISIDPVILLPNTFSPNGDGLNDKWEIPLLKLFPDCIVEVFNRAGQIVFRSVGYNTPWDGRQSGKDLPIGTYYYMIKPSREQPAIGGSITVIR